MFILASYIVTFKVILLMLMGKNTTLKFRVKFNTGKKLN